MNAGLLALLRDAPGVRVARIPAGRNVAILAGYPAGAGYPAWVAKIASGEDVRGRLRREHAALVYLAAAADDLQIPRVLLWEDNERECVFIRTGLEGEADSVAISVESPDAVLARHYEDPLAWLGRFQRAVAAPPPASFAAELERATGWLGAQGVAAMDRLATHLSRAAAAVSGSRLVPVHGDFFPRNILRADRLRVVDWDQFGAGLPLHDLFYLFVGSDLHRHGRLIPMDEITEAAVFSTLPLAGYVRRAIEALGVPAAQVPLNFYCYLAHLLEASQGGVEEPTWRRLLDKLDRAGFPAPGTALPG